MKRVAVSVEGVTEEYFVKDVLQPHLLLHDVMPVPISINGALPVRDLAIEMARLYRTYGAVTSLVDFYGFPKKGPGDVDSLEARLLDKLRDVVKARGHGTLNEEKVRPYVQLHEFEGLLFPT